jgi:hypothetical protein
MDLLESLRMMAAYNRRTKRKAHDVCDGVPDEERKRDLTVTGNLVLIVIFSGYENFMTKIDASRQES